MWRSKPDIGEMIAKKDVEGLAKALRKWDVDSQGIGPLIAIIESHDYELWRVRITAIETLGRSNDERVVAVLLKILVDIRDGGWTPAARILASRKEMSAVDPLLAVLRGDDYLWSGRRVEAAQALGEIGDLRAEQPLLEGLKSTRPYECLACLEALTRLPGNYSARINEDDIAATIATEIRVLYSNTTTEIVGYEKSGSSATGDLYSAIYETAPDPDLKGIQELINKTPVGLREKVRSLSGEARSSF